MEGGQQLALRTLEQKVAVFTQKIDQLREELAKAIVGQHDIVTSFIEALVANGHVLVEGVPGIAKTLTVRTLAQATGCEFRRIQFTPDLLPTDIVGITTYEEGRGFYTIKGPVFGNFILADEINRAPPKVQSALLEAMAEKQVTIGNQTFPLPQPFFVMATQNPVENLGTYPLPEAQVDRFLYKLHMGYPSMEEETEIMHKNMTLHKLSDFGVRPAFSPQEILEAQADAKQVYLDPKVEQYIVRIVDCSRYPKKYGIQTAKYIDFGGSPRSTIGMFIASKAYAMVRGKVFVTPHDVKQVAHKILRHRIILNYEGQAEGISVTDIIEEMLQRVPIVEKKS